MSPPPAPSPAEPRPSRFRVKKGRPSGPPGPWVLFAAWGPCGYAPVAPGTFGTLGAIPLYWLLSRGGTAAVAAGAVVLFALGVPAAARAGRYWGVVDASPIVIDEVIGYLVAVTAVPFSWPGALAAFLLFRIFDVLKPWPASALDRVKTGLGVVLDDVAAGAWAWVALQALAAGLRAWLGCGAGGPWCSPLG